MKILFLPQLSWWHHCLQKIILAIRHPQSERDARPLGRLESQSLDYLGDGAWGLLTLPGKNWEALVLPKREQRGRARDSCGCYHDPIFTPYGQGSTVLCNYVERKWEMSKKMWEWDYLNLTKTHHLSLTAEEASWFSADIFGLLVLMTPRVKGSVVRRRATRQGSATASPWRRVRSALTVSWGFHTAVEITALLLNHGSRGCAPRGRHTFTVKLLELEQWDRNLNYVLRSSLNFSLFVIFIILLFFFVQMRSYAKPSGLKVPLPHGKQGLPSSSSARSPPPRLLRVGSKWRSHGARCQTRASLSMREASINNGCDNKC